MTECKLLVALVKELIRCLDQAGIQLRRYDGAGAIAAALMLQWGVKELIAKPRDDMILAIRTAYSGGRIEAPKIGNTAHTLWRYDINSAYPSSACTLPALREARWERRQQGYDNIDWSCPMNLAHIQYHFTEGQLFYPLFTRWPDNSIKYCSEGEGWFWRPELELLRDFYHENIDYEVIECWNAYVDKPEYPLNAHIRNTYAKRMYFKSLVGPGRPKGHMAQEGIKLGMNSIYGKFAQQQGYREAIPGVREARYPSYHDLAWAGIITSDTRAKLFRAAMQAPQDVIAFATDAVFSFSRLDLPVGKDLGEWDETEIEAMTIVQPGVYWCKINGEWESKFRGFDRDSLSRELVVDKWRHGEDTLPVTLTRFVGMGSALKLVEYDGKWRTWDTQRRELSLVPQGKRTSLFDPMWAEEMWDTDVQTNVFLEMSKPFNLRWVHDNDGSGRSISEDEDNNIFRLQDEAAKELEDSYL
jgi:DNA polymerase type B, organellar and viral